jgi:hypothetical protein
MASATPSSSSPTWRSFRSRVKTHAVAGPVETDETDVKLPRGRGFKLSTAEIFRILITLGLLVALISLTKPCSQAVSTFVMGFGSGSGSGSNAGSGSGSAKPDPYADPYADPYVRLTPGMTEEQVKAAIQQAKEKNLHPAVNPTPGNAAAGSGSGADAITAHPNTRRGEFRVEPPPNTGSAATTTGSAATMAVPNAAKPAAGSATAPSAP